AVIRELARQDPAVGNRVQQVKDSFQLPPRAQELFLKDVDEALSVHRLQPEPPGPLGNTIAVAAAAHLFYQTPTVSTWDDASITFAINSINQYTVDQLF